MDRELIERVVDYFLDDYDFEDFLEEFDLEPVDVFMFLYDQGLVDEEKMEKFLLAGV